jgi:hypothetical protein
VHDTVASGSARINAGAAAPFAVKPEEEEVSMIYFMYHVSLSAILHMHESNSAAATLLKCR